MRQTADPRPAPSVVGYLLPVYDRRGPSPDGTPVLPVLLLVEGVRFVPLFSRVDLLWELLALLRPPRPWKVMELTGDDALASILGRYRVALDPRQHPGRRVTWTELYLPAAGAAAGLHEPEGGPR